MDQKQEIIGNKIRRVLEVIIICAGLLTLGILFLLGMIVTVYFVDGYTEIPYYNSKSAIPVLLLSVAAIGLYVLGRRKGIADKINQKKLLTGLLIFAYAFGALWIMLSHSYPVADRNNVSLAAASFLRDDYTMLEFGQYIFVYPYQLFYVAFLELCYYLVGNEYYFFPQMINAVVVMFICYHLYRLTGELFEEEDTSGNVLLLLFGALAMFFYTTYVYGNLPGLVFSIWALRRLTDYIKYNRLSSGIMAVILIAIGVLFKKNFMIFLLAMAITLFLSFLQQKKRMYLVMIVLLFTVRALLNWGLDRYYENRSGLEIGDGQPMLASLAMGLQEDEDAPGWHNGFDINIFIESEYDPVVTKEKAKDNIYGSLHRMKEDPLAAAGFFLKKTVTQWCEPTYQSLWDSNCADNHTMKLSKLTQNIYSGKINGFLLLFMDVFQSLIWGLSLFCIWYRRKKLRPIQLSLVMILAGGFVFQLFWEAKAQYNLPYMMIMLPFAAGGLHDIYQAVQNRWQAEEKDHEQEQNV